MPKFCANLSLMFNESPFLERFALAAGAGFKGVEFLFPYEYAAAELVELLKAHGLEQVLFNMPPGDWAAGERGLAALPDRVAEFRDGVERAVDYAVQLGCQRIHCMAGIPPDGADLDAAAETYVSNLRFAAEKLSPHGMNLLVEPINTRDMPGYFVSRSHQAMDLIARAGADNIRLQYDCYHMQIMEGDLCPSIERLLPSIAHVQAADTPGRHEPGTGEINYPFVFAWLDRLGYDGWVGCEYRPKGETLAGLSWARDYLS